MSGNINVWVRKHDVGVNHTHTGVCIQFEQMDPRLSTEWKAACRGNDHGGRDATALPPFGSSAAPFSAKGHTDHDSAAQLIGAGRSSSPRTYDPSREVAIEAGQYLKQKNPNSEVTVRDLEGAEETLVIQWQQPRGQP